MVLTFKGLATSLFGNTVDKYSDFFSIIKNNLSKANIAMAFRTYMSIVLFTTVFSYAMSLAFLFLALRIVTIAPFQRITYLIFVPLLNSIVVFVLLTFYPLQKSAVRARDIESNLPFVLTHMGAIAESGIPPYMIFRLIGEFEEYGEISKEMRKIVRNIETFGIDPLSAVKEAAERTPSEEFKQILLGFVTTTESGGNIKTYLKSTGQQALFEWKNRREKFLQQLAAYAEFYTGLLIAAPLFIISLFAVMNMIQPNIGGYSIVDLTKLSIYLLVPAMNTGFLLFLRGVEVEI